MLGRLARTYRDGKGVEQNLGLAIKYFELAIKHIDWAKNELFDLLYSIGDVNSLSRAIQIAEEFKITKNGAILGRIGRAYRDGKGVEQNYETATRYFSEARSRGCQWANHELFDLYLTIGTNDSLIEAHALALEFKNSMNGEMLGRLAKTYNEGIGIEKNQRLALLYFIKSSKFTDKYKIDLYKTTIQLNLSDQYIINKEMLKTIVFGIICSGSVGDENVYTYLKNKQSLDLLMLLLDSRTINELYETKDIPKTKILDDCQILYELQLITPRCNYINTDTIPSIINKIIEYGLERNILEKNDIKHIFSSFYVPNLKIQEYQLSSLCLLHSLDILCKKNSIEYWMVFGSLIGSYRHNGFIPWDDDIDIGMMRNQFNSLKKVLEKDPLLEIKTMLIVYDSANGQSCLIDKIYFRDNRDIFIDIFVYDCINADVNDIKMTVDMYKQKLLDETSMLIKEDLFIKHINPETDPKVWKTYKKYNDIILKKYGSKKGKVIVNNIKNPIIVKSQIFENKDIVPFKKETFEDLLINTPNNTEKVLYYTYGDVLRFPNDFLKHTHFNENVDGFSVIINHNYKKS